MTYPKIAAYGRLLEGLFSRPVIVQEKVDGSQFSFGVTSTGSLWMRSKRRNLDIKSDDGQFNGAKATVLAAYNAGNLVSEATYYGECISKPRHNVLVYDRAPKGCIVLWDVQNPMGEWVTDLGPWAEAVGCESTHVICPSVKLNGIADLKQFLNNESMLGGCTIEGVVAKRYECSHLYVGKHVSPAFKEKHGKKPNPNAGKGTVTEQVLSQMPLEPRWNKAIAALHDDDTFTGTMSDIGTCIKTLMKDFDEEDTDWAKEFVWTQFSKNIKTGLSRGFAPYFKDYLEEYYAPADEEE